MILFIRHIEIEGPGTLGEFFSALGFATQVIALDQGHRFPEDLSAVQAVVSLGGPMNVYEEGKYPFLVLENEFIREILLRKIPFLGICLGSQLLAKAAGAQVKKSPVKEVGWYDVDIKPEGQQDTLFSGLDRAIEVYQWHEDMWELPDNGTLLASSPDCPHQAFKIGENAYGLQFHVEITGPMISDWCQMYLKQEEQASLAKANEMVLDYEIKKKRLRMTTNRLYANFLKVVEAGSVPV